MRRLRRVSVPDRRIRVQLKILKDAILRFYDSGTDCLLDLCDVLQTRKFMEEIKCVPVTKKKHQSLGLKRLTNLEPIRLNLWLKLNDRVAILTTFDDGTDVSSPSTANMVAERLTSTVDFSS